MKRINKFPYPVKVLEHVTIPMRDGTKLAAKIWLPEQSDQNPVPAILEYIPYRKRDFKAYRDSMMHPYFAGHGYAAVRVDLRGSGDSDGVLQDEYLTQELEDGLDILKWLEKQTWCDGKVGMIGKSWGGFNSLQIAYLQPPQLKAIITVCSTDDRYADDVHYMGGCLLGDNLSWASVMFAYNSCPPDPELVGTKWRQMWFERLKHSGLWLKTWLEHQHRDAYWKHGSICEDYSAIQCPVFAVSGWADGYSNAVFRLLQHLNVPRLGLVGPWSHKYPHLGVPGPAIGFLQEALRWWDHWLKEKDTGIMNEPILRAWMQDSVPPTTMYAKRPGRWVCESNWPSDNIQYQCYPLKAQCVGDAGESVEESVELKVQSPLTVGLFAGKWCSYSATPDLPHDQRQEDGGALVFDSDWLEAPLEILGSPVLDLHFSVDKPVAMIAVRLSDIAPDNQATRVTYGIFNLTHRNSHEHPERLEPGKPYHVRIELNEIGQVFPKGHCFRVAISTSYWPLAWPPPESVQLTVYTGKSRIELPVRPPQEEDQAVTFKEAEASEPLPMTMHEPPHGNWWVKRDLANDVSTLEVVKDDGVYYIPSYRLEMWRKENEKYTVQGNDFNSPAGETSTTIRLKRDQWKIQTNTFTRLTCDSKNFYLHARLDAYENDVRVHSQNWTYTIERKLL